MTLAKLFPSRALLLLVLVSSLDLVVTAVLHRQGRIVELNPLMRPLIERSEWWFALVKGATIFAAWLMMARYGAENRGFVRRAACAGVLLYVTLWSTWFVSAR